MVSMHGSKSPRPVRVEVELRRAGRDELRERAADATPTTEAVERQASGHVKAAHSWNWTNKWIGVGGHRVRMADELDDAGLAHERETPRRAGQQRLEARLVGRQ